MTVVVQLAVPDEPLTLPVYVVVTVGVTLREPLATGMTAPIPWSIVNDVAFVVVHDSVELFPNGIDVGAADNVHVGSCDAYEAMSVSVPERAVSRSSR